MGEWTTAFMIGITTYFKDYLLLPLRLITVSNVTTIINLFPNQPLILYYFFEILFLKTGIKKAIKVAKENARSTLSVFNPFVQ